MTPMCAIHVALWALLYGLVQLHLTHFVTHIRHLILVQAKGRISIQAGAGVNAAIVPELWRTGIRAFHATARYWEQEEQRLGFEGRWMPDEEKIKALRHEVDRCSKI